MSMFTLFSNYLLSIIIPFTYIEKTNKGNNNNGRQSERGDELASKTKQKINLRNLVNSRNIVDSYTLSYIYRV
jgi:hypothetical protein